jgi:hypothetical protein
MKSTVARLFSFAMSLLVLASTLSWTVEKHLCMGHVVSVALFAEAEGCGMAMDADNHCCDNERFTVQGQDDLKQSVFEYAVSSLVYAVPAMVSIVTPLPIVEVKKSIAVHLYHPPPLPKDIHILHQVFLI